MAPNSPSNDSATPTAPTIAVPPLSRIRPPPATVPPTMHRNVVASISAVAGDQFVLGQQLRQHAVFHRSEQRRLHAKPHQHREQRRNVA